ncbi:uncharacterized protein LOC142784677 [Rhipicephalus microplus]|uniref:uncharacterized protein LOC142784677 n=1 Tax=Rhipicephalus microplus TaxID=6941 RepID=UPI003F6B771A
MLSGSGSGKRAFSSGELPTSSGGQFTRTDSTSTAKTSAEEPRHPHSYFGSDDAANCKRGPPRRTSKASKGGSVSDSSRSSARYKKGRKQKLSPPTEEATSSSEANRKRKQRGKKSQRTPETSTSPDVESST